MVEVFFFFFFFLASFFGWDSAGFYQLHIAMGTELRMNRVATKIDRDSVAVPDYGVPTGSRQAYVH